MSQDSQPRIILTSAALAAEVNQLCGDEYLDFLIESFYRNYANQKICLSVFNLQRQLVFFTKQHAKLFEIKNSARVLSKTLDQLPFLNKNYPYLIKPAEQVFEDVYSTGETSNFIVFDQYRELIGALHYKINAIFDPQENICGIVIQTSDFTRLFWGLHYEHYDARQEALSSTEKDILHSLTPKEQQILFLTALGITQEHIAQWLKVSRGNIAKRIRDICKKFACNILVANQLLNQLGTLNVLQELKTSQLLLGPITIKINEDFSFLNQLS